jgi:hypothetical protein
LEGTLSFGGTLVGDYGPVFFLASYDNTGALRWAIRDSAGALTYANDLAVDRQGNCLVTGFTYLGSWDPHVDSFVAKYDRLGRRQWLKVEGQPSTDEAAWRATADSVGNFYVIEHATSRQVLARYDLVGTRSV